MQTQNYENADAQVHALAEKYQDTQGLSYSDALKQVAREKPELWRRYSRGESDAGAKFTNAAGERERRIMVYQEHFQVDERRATEMVDEHDPNMRNIPLDAGSIVDARARERMAAGRAKTYNQAMQQVLDADEHLKRRYTTGQPYIEAARKYVEDPMASAEVRAITEPRPDAIVTPSPDKPTPEFTNTARLRLGAMLAGAKGPDGGIDVQLALRIAGLVPDEVQAAAGEALDELTRAMINRRGMRGTTSQAYPEAYRLAVAEHPDLWAASQSGTLSEDGLKDLFVQWFKD